VIGARAVNSDDHLLLVSRNGQSVRFPAADDVLRPMGRATSGVTGMKFREDDELLAMAVVTPDTYVVTVTDGGFAKRTSVDEYRVQGRGGLGIRVAKLPDDRGHLVGAAVVEETDEILVVMEKGRVVRSRVAEIPPKGRSTMGVTFAKPDKGDQILLVTTSAETEEDVEDAGEPDGAEGVEESDGAAGAGTPGGAAGAGTPDGAEGAGESDPVESAETAESEDFVDSAAPGSSPQPDALGSDESDQSPTGDVPNEE